MSTPYTYQDLAQIIADNERLQRENEQLRASRLVIAESLDAVMRERDLLKAQLSSELSGLVDINLLMAVKKVQP